METVTNTWEESLQQGFCVCACMRVLATRKKFSVPHEVPSIITF